MNKVNDIRIFAQYILESQFETATDTTEKYTLKKNFQWLFDESIVTNKCYEIGKILFEHWKEEIYEFLEFNSTNIWILIKKI